MKWFWRLVCEPDCSDACQINCPGCRALAGEWESQGRVTAAGTAPPVEFRWRNLPVLWECWSKSVSARTLARLNPVRYRRAETAQAGCSCHAPAATGTGLKEEVKRHYSARAQALTAQAGGDCCAPALPTEVSAAPMYSDDELSGVPAEALLASLGCGNPLARADLKPGEAVLDLGSGGGMDVLAAAARVSPGGTVFGLDSSDDMLALARASAAKAGAGNVIFLKGDLEAIPLPSDSVDVIISNCVVNLAPDKRRAMSEAFRVLRPGGRLAISDIVTREPVPAPLKESLTAWAACIGGALSEDEYQGHLQAAGFTDIVIYRDREYTAEDAAAAGLLEVLAQGGLDTALRLGFASAGVCARKTTGISPPSEGLDSARKPLVVQQTTGGCGCGC
ncbi:MAG: arsenite methyltransferase [Nocardiopsaceae bacterium]|nr:arsenite methyltransferase [Nocardiopsaceae bacterium]